MPNRHPAEPGVVEVISGRNPYQLYLMFLLAISGLSILLTAPAPQSLERQFPVWALTAWGVALLLGGVVNLVATLVRWHDRITGMYFEIFSCAAIVFAGGMYTFAALASHVANSSYIGVGLVSILAVASLWRLIQLSIYVRKIHAIRAQYSEVLKVKPEGEI